MDDSKLPVGMIGPALLPTSVNLTDFAGFYSLGTFVSTPGCFCFVSLHSQLALSTNIYFDSFMTSVKHPEHWTRTDFQFVQWDNNFVNLRRGRQVVWGEWRMVCLFLILQSEIWSKPPWRFGHTHAGACFVLCPHGSTGGEENYLTWGGSQWVIHSRTGFASHSLLEWSWGRKGGQMHSKRKFPQVNLHSFTGNTVVLLALLSFFSLLYSCCFFCDEWLIRLSLPPSLFHILSLADFPTHPYW